MSLVSLLLSLAGQNAGARPAPQGGADFISSILPMLIVMGAILYFFSIRPQIRQKKEHEALLKALKKGDYVLTQSGFFAKIVDVKAGRLSVLLGSSEVDMLPSAVVSVVKPDAADKAFQEE